MEQKREQEMNKKKAHSYVHINKSSPRRIRKAKQQKFIGKHTKQFGAAKMREFLEQFT